MQPHTLKRTISKCSMDVPACKKLSGPDMEPFPVPLEPQPRAFSPYTVAPSPTLKQDAPDRLSASKLIDTLLEYLSRYCRSALSFSQLFQMLQSLPFAVGTMQTLVHSRLALSWPLVAAVVQNVTAFIADEDIRDASVGELVPFLQSCRSDAALMKVDNVCVHLFEFFRETLARFKHFLIKQWLHSGRIRFPCEFGKKSDALFLCMECHREHL